MKSSDDSPRGDALWMSLATLIALVPSVWSAVAPSATFESMSMGAWAALVWLAVAGVGVVGHERSAGTTALARGALAAPTIVLGLVTDSRSIGWTSAHVLAAAFAWIFVVAQFALSARASERSLSIRLLIAWLVCVALGPVLELALTQGAGTAQAPALVAAWSSFSPARWAFADLDLARRVAADALVLSAWKPAIALVVFAAIASSGSKREERAS